MVQQLQALEDFSRQLGGYRKKGWLATLLCDAFALVAVKEPTL